MRTFLSRLVAAVAATFMILGAASPAAAQAMGGRQLPDRPTVGLSYYKVQAGKQDEWIDLYKKWHRPILENSIKEGFLTSANVYANASHALAPQWDFVVIYVSPPASQKPKGQPTNRGALIQKLFPDLDAYTAGEKARWALVETHWDEEPMEVDLNVEHPGVYYPILPKK